MHVGHVDVRVGVSMRRESFITSIRTAEKSRTLQRDIPRPTRQPDGSYGPIPKPKRARKYRKNAMRRPLTHAERKAARYYEQLGFAHLDFCTECETLLDSLAHQKLLTRY